MIMLQSHCLVVEYNCYIHNLMNMTCVFDEWTTFHQIYKYYTVIAGNFGGGKFGEFGESSVIRQTKTTQLSTYN